MAGNIIGSRVVEAERASLYPAMGHKIDLQKYFYHCVFDGETSIAIKMRQSHVAPVRTKANLVVR